MEAVGGALPEHVRTSNATRLNASYELGEDSEMDECRRELQQYEGDVGCSLRCARWRKGAPPEVVTVIQTRKPERLVSSFDGQNEPVVVLVSMRLWLMPVQLR